MNKYFKMCAPALLALSLAACGTDKAEESTSTNNTAETSATESQTELAKTQTITYLGEKYELPAEVKNIVAASLESMEDAAMLGIKPVGVLEVGGKVPAYLASDFEGATLVGNKMEPNAEAILNLDPDVIVGTSKFPEETAEKLKKIQTMIPYSHISTNWKENLTVLAQLAGKEDDAKKIISDYEAKVADAQVKSKEQLADKQVLIIRVRGGVMYIYPAGVYLNPVLYEDLGAPVPEVVTTAKAQAELSLETLAQVNPDAIFLQFEESENKDTPKALEELQKNPIFTSLKASQNKEIYVNTIDPLAQGGTAWSKVKFLDAAAEKLLK
ncbi:ABC transporter substrate-binding protein [Lysinibacillus sp. FSL M8-0216]|uniref:Bacillibactin-binding protein n=1 Tax=Lysinibacillus fusiformis TaxID=28031 RepID=A0A1H9F459_9BACI|nr:MULTISPECIES: ABC transporter substrate-binding protein [Lysinibacillus]MCG7436217.1 ABC transporter substrate-binding protein [Lysinibacillus fusiformis]MED4669284.1 ABC transporter substrate-binding protein [Lysinibacillus fusiformis]NOG29670.1 ABC transporter substrate-binding protein [Lysinibacillus fusiformis]PCD81088.1 iron-uptake system-binding protein [Lysinibacillus fusiformis]QAS57779.1 iron-uptake system-binding protein [Lysinibacillus sphaericus]